MAVLPTNYLDDILAASMGGKRRFRITHEDGSTEEVTLEDVSEYEQVGSPFGSGDVNKTNQAVNEKLDSADVVDPALATVLGFAADAKLTGDALSELNKNCTFYGIAIGNDVPQVIEASTSTWTDITNWKLKKAVGFVLKNGAWECPKDGIIRVDVIIECKNTKQDDNCKLSIRSPFYSYRFGGRPSVENLGFAWSASGIFPVSAGDIVKINGIEWGNGEFTILGSNVSCFCVSYI